MKNFFGTDGIRGTLGQSPFTQEESVRLGNAIGQWIIATYGRKSNIVIVHDTRESGEWLTHALCTGLLQYPITIHKAGTLPTPAVPHLLAQHPQLHCGIILSASHNPYQDNGIKIIDRIEGKISVADEQAISSAYEKNQPTDYIEFGSVVSFAHASEQYMQTILDRFSLSLRGKKIVLDCANGAVHAVAPQIFSSLGAEVITLHDAPNGTNINAHCGALHPQSLAHAVLQHAADLGCAFDGDGDRVILVNNRGDIKNGDDMLALLAMHPAYEKQATVVGTVMSNQGLEPYLKDAKKSLLRTPVGDRWIAMELKQKNLLLGGEQSGHIILHDILPTGDGIATALRVIESMQHTDNWNMETFQRFPQKLINVPIAHKKDLKEPSIAAIIAEYQQQLESGRVYVRYSGTENFLRVMVEDREDTKADRICSHLAQALEKALQ